MRRPLLTLEAGLRLADLGLSTGAAGGVAHRSRDFSGGSSLQGKAPVAGSESLRFGPLPAGAGAAPFTGSFFKCFSVMGVDGADALRRSWIASFEFVVSDAWPRSYGRLQCAHLAPVRLAGCSEARA